MGERRSSYRSYAGRIFQNWTGVANMRNTRGIDIGDRDRDGNLGVLITIRYFVLILLSRGVGAALHTGILTGRRMRARTAQIAEAPALTSVLGPA